MVGWVLQEYLIFFLELVSGYFVAPLKKKDPVELANNRKAVEELYSSVSTPDDYPFIEKVIRSQLFHFFLQNDI